MQHILDLENVEEHRVHPEPLANDLPLPERVREAGFLPDIDALQPGDLILYSARSKFNLVPAGISFVQGKGGYSWEHARWTHAAVYLGEFQICEATREGVALNELTKAMVDCCLRVRRGHHRGQFIDRETGWRTALFAVMRLHQRYDTGHAAGIANLARKGFGQYRPEPPKGAADAVICSELFQDAYCRATNVQLQNPLSREVTPAFLSATPLLKDVECNWRKLSC